MSADENKDLIGRYIEAVDNNDTGDRSILDEYIAKEFVAHDPPIPGGREPGSWRDEAGG